MPILGCAIPDGYGIGTYLQLVSGNAFGVDTGGVNASIDAEGITAVTPISDHAITVCR